jgi:hypothetical protein
LILLVGSFPDVVFRRIGAELRALGFEVEAPHDGETVSTRADIEALAQSTNAVAAIQVDATSASLRIWKIDRDTGRVFPAISLPMGHDETVLALRAVESVRASLVDLKNLVPERPSPLAPPTAERPAPRAHHLVPSFGAFLGPAVALSPGPIGASFQAFGSGHWMAGAHWGLEAIVVAPLVPTRWSNAEGTATLAFGLAALGLRYRPPVSGPWSVDLAGGMGVVLLHGEGVPINDSFLGHQRDNWTAISFVRLGGSVELFPSLRLRGDIVTALALSPVVYTMVDGARAVWGRPLAVATVGLEMVGR